MVSHLDGLKAYLEQIWLGHVGVSSICFACNDQLANVAKVDHHVLWPAESLNELTTNVLFEFKLFDLVLLHSKLLQELNHEVRD